jgi:hypothetical protein
MGGMLRHGFIVGVLVAAAAQAGCGARITDPAASLRNPKETSLVHRDALRMLMEQPGPPAAAGLDAVQGLAYRPGYDTRTRLEGLAWLERVDRDMLLTTLRRRLPRVSDHDWLRAVCGFVAQQHLTELDVPLVSSWGRPWSGNLPDVERPEYLALRAMHGAGAPERIVWETFLGATKPSQNGLRFRCWDLLHRLGHRDRLIELVSEASTHEDGGHPLLKPLQAAAVSFGTVPWNREEVLWIHKLAEPARSAFWEAAEQATATLSPDRRASLEIRDLPVVAAAAAHRPELLAASPGQLYTQIQRRIAGQRHYREQDPGFVSTIELDHHLAAHRDVMTWGDLLAINMALHAVESPQVRAHLFDYADRDLADETTEYGGVIDLDAQGRFNVREFPPRIRVHDRRFEAPQQMFDAGYTGLFHFHNHVQKHRNGMHAGPGDGDMTYANNTRANCLVLTFVDEQTLNLDFYRHDGVLVDLGVILRPSVNRGSG